ncbi:virion structural protein [Pseudomonas phage Noxifer]|uniref:Virion structural protein n=1 Tax=Pseudomonas phage Noxifer TaxID=2006684 RepID=A0A1Y0SV68_9CAUD|nr:virion structural protein [Pseudomonas phage Noxifer]ARV77300.1 virion structural protein [Pseudomonas phage Noxifer]
MSQFNYISYRNEIFRLVRSIVIKSSHVSDVINADLIGRNIVVDLEDPTTWKYYLNLAGVYHASDTMMQVRSMDTREMIDFTVENLRYHRATAREYLYGTVYYNNLVAKYPTQVDLIKGIIAPVNIQTAINSNNGDILYYDASLVEGNEDNLIRELQGWVHAYQLRWFNQGYLLTDDLYLQHYIGQLYLALPKAIENLRWRNCNTRRAHSFHIREWLASHGRLDRYLPYLTKSQQLWLYRNIVFIKSNPGRQEIFDRLVDKLLTPRGIPLIRYTLNQNTDEMPTELYSKVEMVKHDINMKSIAPGNEKTTVANILDRESLLARDNPKVAYDAEVEIEEKVKMSGFSSMPTKILDSEVVDRSNSSIRNLLNVLLNHWVYLSTHGRYRAYVSIPHPRSGEYMTMTVKDALICSLFAVGKIYGYDFPKIPVMHAYDVLRSPLPTFDELQSIVPKGGLREGMIQAVMDRVTPLSEYISTERFYLDCAQLHKEYLKLWELYSFQEHYMARNYAEQVVRRHFMHVRCPLIEEQLSFEQYFKDNQFEIADLDQFELEQLLTDCINIATGSNLVKVVTLGEVQRELLSLIAGLSSYPLQFMSNVAFTDFTVLGLLDTRFGDHWAETSDSKVVIVDDWTVRHMHTETRVEFALPAEVIDPTVTYGAETGALYHYDPMIEVKEIYDRQGAYRLDGASVGIRGFSFVWDETPITDGQMDQYKP